jgi:hypothetical protein
MSHLDHKTLWNTERKKRIIEYLNDNEALSKRKSQLIENGLSERHFDIEIQYLYKKVKDPTYEEEQANRKDWHDKYGDDPGMYYKLKCWHCGRVFYATYPLARYCTYRCTNVAYSKRRKERKQEIRSNRVCLFCGKTFKSTRTHTKYCCESHRVLACLKRKKEKTAAVATAATESAI